MPELFDSAAFGERLRKTRTTRDLKLSEVADLTGVSIATLSRIERGEASEIESSTLAALARWMRVSLDLFSGASKSLSKNQSTPDAIELHLRADKHLDSNTAAVLAKMFRAAYEELSTKVKKD